MPDLTKLIYHVVDALEARDEPPEESALLNLVRAHATALSLSGGAFTDEDIVSVSRHVQTRFSVRMPMGAMFEEGHEPWLTTREGEIDWYYWARYRKYLLKKGFPPHVARTLDAETDRILDHLADPREKGVWARKGMVVGHVQSGKTANYNGVICKAADAGYRVIVVLGGMLTTLRNQTQRRIDADFMGWCTVNNIPIGASAFDDRGRPVCFTTALEDFQKSTANSIAMNLQALNVPFILVVKKHKSTLENVYTWLRDNNRCDLKDLPMLLIDDEADHASINTNPDDKDATTINLCIRNILSLFPRSSFVGYTATPFANIFIDPESESEMKSGEDYKDLFPRDFILTLDAPDNYVGPGQVFGRAYGEGPIRQINDHKDVLPLKHPITFIPEILPDSLERAMCCFVIAKTIRSLRSHVNRHHSMLINISRFTGVQNHMANLISERLKEIKQSVRNYAGLSENVALENVHLSLLRRVWEEEFSSAGFEWRDVQSGLKEGIDPIEVVPVNSSSTERLSYDENAYPKGRSIIAVGGIGLSRGLTLEGLVTSYFLRNSVMYDTLMQMGRWFGYRDEYADLCRVYMTPDAISWYAHIAEATDELREDFKSMEKAKLTPVEFGLRVRSHPASLIVTARNKMRTGKRVPVMIALEGRLAETSVIHGQDDLLERNREILKSLVESISHDREVKKSELGYLWKSVPSGLIRNTVETFENHPECMLTNSKPIVDYIDRLAADGIKEFDVLLCSVGKGVEMPVTAECTIFQETRTVPSITEKRIEFAKRRVASKGSERAGLTPTQIACVRAVFDGNNIPDKAYRKVDGRNPLFMVHFVQLREREDGPIVKDRVPAYGISFPGDAGAARRPTRLVEYMVTTKWWQQNFEEGADEV